jgi:sugar phosphate isomerase/epimerase
VNTTIINQLCINTATFGWNRSLIDALNALANSGVKHITPWRHQIQHVGPEIANAMIRDAGLSVSALCRGGMFTYEDKKSYTLAIDDNLRAIDEAAIIGAKSLTLVVGGLPSNSKNLKHAHEQITSGIAKILPHARQAGITLAIEPLHPMFAADRSCINSLTHANDLCDLLGEGVGIALDVYHVWWDPRLSEEIIRAGEKRIVGFHICDWLVPTSDLLLDRGMMGDGVIDIPAIRVMLEKVGYTGLHEVEIFSEKNWWQRSPKEILQHSIERHHTHV